MSPPQRPTTQPFPTAVGPEILECGRADLAHFSHIPETHWIVTWEKQNEFSFIVSERLYFLVVDNWERAGTSTSPFVDHDGAEPRRQPIHLPGRLRFSELR